MSKYNVGDKVRIVDEPVDGKRYCWLSEMDKWRGRAMTIDQVLLWGYGMKEMSDIGWDEKMIAGLAIPNDVLLDKLTTERQEFEDKIVKIGKKIASGTLQPEDVDRLSIQQRSFKTDSMILTSRINAIKRTQKSDRQLTSLTSFTPSLDDLHIDFKKPEKKYNVVAYKGITGKTSARFWYRLGISDETNAIDEISVSGGFNNGDEDQQWTDAQIKEYGLEDYEKIEVEVVK